MAYADLPTTDEPEALMARALYLEAAVAEATAFVAVLEAELAREMNVPPYTRNNVKIAQLREEIARIKQVNTRDTAEAKRLRDRAAQLQQAVADAISRGLTPEVALTEAQAAANRRDTITGIIKYAAIAVGVAVLVWVGLKLVKYFRK